MTDSGGRALAVAMMLGVLGCADGEPKLSLRRAPAALGPGEAPALAYTTEGYIAAWEADNAGSREVRYRRLGTNNVTGQDVVVGPGAQPRLETTLGPPRLAWIGPDAAGDDQVFFTNIEAGAAPTILQVTHLPPAGDFPAHDLAYVSIGHASAVCDRHQDGTGSLLYTRIENGAVSPSHLVAPVRCKDVSMVMAGTGVWIAYTENAAGGDSAFAQRIDYRGFTMGPPLRLGTVGQGSSAPRVLRLPQLATAVIFHDGASEQPMLQLIASTGAASGPPVPLDVSGAIASTFSANLLQPGMLVAYRQATTLRARAFDDTGLPEVVALDIGPASDTAPAVSWSTPQVAGLLYVNEGMITFAEVGVTR